MSCCYSVHRWNKGCEQGLPGRRGGGAGGRGAGTTLLAVCVSLKSPLTKKEGPSAPPRGCLRRRPHSDNARAPGTGHTLRPSAEHRPRGRVPGRQHRRPAARALLSSASGQPQTGGPVGPAVLPSRRALPPPPLPVGAPLLEALTDPPFSWRAPGSAGSWFYRLMGTRDSAHFLPLDPQKPSSQAPSADAADPRHAQSGMGPTPGFCLQSSLHQPPPRQWPSSH